MTDHRVTALIELLDELETLRQRVRDLETHQADITRRVYRRGYGAGYWAGRRGQTRVSSPERNARGETRRLLAGTR